MSVSQEELIRLVGEICEVPELKVDGHLTPAGNVQAFRKQPKWGLVNYNARARVDETPDVFPLSDLHVVAVWHECSPRRIRLRVTENRAAVVDQTVVIGGNDGAKDENGVGGLHYANRIIDLADGRIAQAEQHKALHRIHRRDRLPKGVGGIPEGEYKDLLAEPSVPFSLYSKIPRYAKGNRRLQREVAEACRLCADRRQKGQPTDYDSLVPPRFLVKPPVTPTWRSLGFTAEERSQALERFDRAEVVPRIAGGDWNVGKNLVCAGVSGRVTEVDAMAGSVTVKAGRKKTVVTAPVSRLVERMKEATGFSFPDLVVPLVEPGAEVEPETCLFGPRAPEEAADPKQLSFPIDESCRFWALLATAEDHDDRMYFPIEHVIPNAEKQIFVQVGGHWPDRNCNIRVQRIRFGGPGKSLPERLKAVDVGYMLDLYDLSWRAKVRADNRRKRRRS